MPNIEHIPRPRERPEGFGNEKVDTLVIMNRYFTCWEVSGVPVKN